MRQITRLDMEIYRCVSEQIATDEVIITDERIRHIRERHPNDFEQYEAYLARIIEEPDYLLRDKMPNTAMVLKAFEEEKSHFRLALRLATAQDNPEYKNSVLTFLKIREKEWNRLIKNKDILYKAE